MNKTVICRCEDVTTHDIENAIGFGLTDIESIKRYTGIGTGYCQGKGCLAKAASYIAGLVRLPSSEIVPITPRPPFSPTALKYFNPKSKENLLPAIHKKEFNWDDDPLPDSQPISHSKTLHELPEKASTVIIGGGVVGLSLAYHLSKLGVEDIVVLEKGYLNSGATGRCGGGVRQQWATENNVLMMKENIKIFKEFASETGINTWFRQGGYLFVATSDEQQVALEKNCQLHNSLGVKTKILTPLEAEKVVPGLNKKIVKVASYNATDGIVFPWPILWGYRQALKKMGVKICTFTKVSDFDIVGRKIKTIYTNRGSIKSNRVINAAGAWSPGIAKLAGVSLPNMPYKHEILVSEQFRMFLKPMVVLLGDGLYFSQSMRGEIVGGITDPDEKPSIALDSSLRFLQLFSRSAMNILPLMSEVKVMRQWAGYYDVTPDNNPILGDVEELDEFIQCNGFRGHGFMMAPYVTKILAERIATGKNNIILDEYNLSRFKSGKLIKESLTIG